MQAADFLAELVHRLESRDLTYALVGSIATMSYGEPRATLDVDVVIALDRSDLDVLEGIHPESGMKVHFFVAGDAIEGAQLERRLRRAILPGVEAWCSPPEELIVKKLSYYQQGASDKHLRDIASMLRISPQQIDLDRVRRLAADRGLAELLARVMESARED